MAGEFVVKNGAPTLAGLKVGNLFAFCYKNETELRKEIYYWNKKLNHKGVFLVAFRKTKNRALIYLYRKSQLEIILRNKEINEFLVNNGYDTRTLSLALYSLNMRLLRSEDFPHEIGIFLGYPIEDVKAFIENKGKNFIFVGCWKVYKNQYDAQKTFAKFKKCTKIYCDKFLNGFDINRLTVMG